MELRALCFALQTPIVVYSDTSAAQGPLTMGEEFTGDRLHLTYVRPGHTHIVHTPRALAEWVLPGPVVFDQCVLSVHYRNIFVGYV